MFASDGILEKERNFSGSEGGWIALRENPGSRNRLPLASSEFRIQFVFLASITNALALIKFYFFGLFLFLANLKFLKFLKFLKGGSSPKYIALRAKVERNKVQAQKCCMKILPYVNSVEYLYTLIVSFKKDNFARCKWISYLCKEKLPPHADWTVEYFSLFASVAILEKERRWMGKGPNFLRACMCAAVP